MSSDHSTVPLLESAQQRTWDAVIVGSGVGGATLGLVLARAGWEVLFVEKGRDLAATAPGPLRGQAAEADPAYREAAPRERLELLARAGRMVEEVLDSVRGQPILPELGSGTGGSSALYGMVLERFFPSDFEPRARHQDAPESTLPEAWPVSHSEMAPFYEQAERLYRVRGGGDPLRGDAAPALLPAIPIGAGAEQLVARLATRGLHPYRLPLACEGVDGCSACQGYLCARACKNDADRIALRPALQQHGAVLLSGCEALALEAQGARVDAVSCESNGQVVSLRGRVVVLAAGALLTPALLLASRAADGGRGLANGSGLVGRNLMRHAIDLWALFRAPRLDGPGDAKAMGFNDLYDGDAGKLGSVQSFGAPIALDTLRNQRGGLWRLAGGLASRAWRRFERIPILATILEDLPYETNRVEPTNSGSPRVRIHYRPGRSERRRRRAFRDRLRPLLGGLGAVCVSGRDAPRALGHACGTCRFGDDPRTSVLDRHNRAHALDNLYVVDGSFFPSSGGINPALTIAANAIRVGEHLVARFGR